MAEVDDWRKHYDLVRASTGRPAPTRVGAAQRPAKSFIAMPSLHFGKSARYVIAAIGFLGFCFFPQTEHRQNYTRDAVYQQIEGRVGDRVSGNYRLVQAEPFPALSEPYDLLVTVENGSYRASATVKGPLAVDVGLSAIRIIAPTEVNALGVDLYGQSTAASVASYAPGFLKGLASSVGGMIDAQGEIRAQSDAQAAARNFIIHRISDRDLALFEAKSVRRIERTDAGLSVVYVDGWSPSGWSPVYWLFIAMLVFGTASSVASWR